MDFQAAASAHRDWNTKLRMYINGSGSLKAEDVGKDNLCALGQWIYGDGKKHSVFPEFDELKKIHAEFHKIASEVILLVDANRKDEAKALIDAGGKFRELSMKILALLVFMEKKAAA